MKGKLTFKRKKSSSVFILLLAALVFTFMVHSVNVGNKASKKSRSHERVMDDSEYAPGEVLLKFKRGVRSKDVTDLADSISAWVEKHYLAISRMNGHIYVLLKSKTMATDDMILELSKHPDVESVSANYSLQVDSTVPNDPRFNELWGLHNTGQTGGTADVDIDAPEAWDYCTGSPGVIAAVIDTGIDYNHTDLAANMWVNPGEIAGNGIDDDGNGFVDDVHGINAITGSGNPMDDHSHGTHCAGTIGAVGNNNQGVAGVNWNVKLLGAKFLDASGSGWTSDAIACLDYIVDMKTSYGQNIVAINASWGGGYYSQSLKDAISAAGTAGIVFCAAAGNYGYNNDTYPHYPSSYDCTNIIAVTGVDHDGAQHYNYGPTSVDLGAPGVSILSTVLCDYTPQPGDIFYDDMESGDGLWSHGGTLDSWAITNAASGGLEDYWWDMSYGDFWSDSPGLGYVYNIDNWLATSGTMDLSSYVGQTVYLGFDGGFQFDYFITNDTAAVEVSDDGGSNWYTLADLTTLYIYYGYYYKKHVYEIPDEYKTADFKFRFHITSDDTYYGYPGYKNKGWIIDNIGVGAELTCGCDLKSGTSMATPHVTGAVVMAASRFPSAPAKKIIRTILKKTVPLPSLSGLCRTGGLLNLDLGTITVTSPNGGENLVLGTTHEITWTAAGLSDNIHIVLQQDGTNVALIAKNMDPAAGSYTWTVGDCLKGAVTSGTNYKILIMEKDTIVNDKSDDFFAITEPSITVTSPNGGEDWTLGATENITWDAVGLSSSDTLYIVLRQSGVNVALIQKDIDPTTGSYSWTVGDCRRGSVTAGTNYRIVLKVKGMPVKDKSDTVFTISSI